MARFSTDLFTAAPTAAVFDYLADFSTLAQWDPGISRAHRLDEGPLAVGSRFEVVAALGPWNSALVYEIVQFDPGHQVVLHADHGDYASHDTITVDAVEGGTSVRYEAVLTLAGPRVVFDPLLQLAFLVICKRAEAGLRAALEDLTTTADRP